MAELKKIIVPINLLAILSIALCCFSYLAIGAEECHGLEVSHSFESDYLTELVQVPIGLRFFGHISYSFGKKARNWSKIAIFSYRYPLLHKN